jgi:hypothetical protein
METTLLQNLVVGTPSLTEPRSIAGAVNPIGRHTALNFGKNSARPISVVKRSQCLAFCTSRKT